MPTIPTLGTAPTPPGSTSAIAPTGWSVSDGSSSIPGLGITGGPSTLTDLENLLNSLQLSGQTAANAGALSGQANADSQALADQILANNAQGFPGAAGLQGQQSTDIAAQLSGTLPQDVVNQLDTQGAERGIATGSPGSPNSTAALMQALGLTSLSQVNQGESALNSALASNRVENPVAPVGLAPVGVAPITNPLNILYPPNSGRSGGSVYNAGSDPSGTGTATNPTLPNMFPGLTPGAVPGGAGLVPYQYPSPVHPGQTATIAGAGATATGAAGAGYGVVAPPGGSSVSNLYPGNPGADYGYTGATDPGSATGAATGGYTDPISGQTIDPYTGLPISSTQASGNWDFSLPDFGGTGTGTGYTDPTTGQPVDPYTGLPIDYTTDSANGGGFNLPPPTGDGSTTVINGVAYDVNTGQPIPGLMPTGQLGSIVNSSPSVDYYSY